MLKVTTYDRGYIDEFGTDIGGTIFMTSNQFLKGLDDLELINRSKGMEYSKHSMVYWLGKLATQRLAEKYGLELQPDTNYQVVVGHR